MAIMEISIIPIGTRRASVSEYIVDAVKVLERRNMNFQVNPMGTVVEGNMADLLDAAREMHESIFHNVEVPRVLTTIRIDDRRDIAEHTMDKKVRSLKEKIKYKK